jgi:hypothetical protein
VVGSDQGDVAVAVEEPGQGCEVAVDQGRPSSAASACGLAGSPAQRIAPAAILG